MAAIPVVHNDPQVRTMIRRALPRRGVRLVSSRTVDKAHSVLMQELVDAIVVDVRASTLDGAIELAQKFPNIPMFAFSRFRPDDGNLIATCFKRGFRGVLVQGVDDGAIGEILVSLSASRSRRESLSDAPRLLRLTEVMQLRAWNEVLDRVGQGTTTNDVAKSLGCSREYISREFAAGGAPNLKRVIDLVRAVWAADLLRNPGYNVRSVSEVLGFSSPSHLAGCARRVAGVAPSELVQLGPKGILTQFRRGRTRSRL